MLTVRYRAKAFDSVKEIIRWYEEQSSGVGKDFYNELSASLALVATMPEMNPFAYRDIRRFSLKNFPYLIYYRVTDDVLWVISVVHERRHREVWKKDMDK